MGLARTEIHLTGAALVGGDGPATLAISTPALSKPVVVATLTSATRQVLLDLNMFPEDVSVTFHVKGPAGAAATEGSGVSVMGSIGLIGPLHDDEEEQAASTTKAADISSAAAAKRARKK